MPFVDREFHVLPSQRAIGKLGQQSPERLLRWRMGEDGTITPRPIDPKGSQNRDVVILQTRGELAVPPWHGACGNCQWGNKGARCSLNCKNSHGKRAEASSAGGVVPGFGKAAAEEAKKKTSQASAAATALAAMEIIDDTDGDIDEGTPTPRKRKGPGDTVEKRKRVRYQWLALVK
ncbi:hypothetical protein ACJ73_10382, partial [Blastomyces percursus]